MKKILRKLNRFLKCKKQKQEWTMADVTRWREELREAYERGIV